jgi:hydroxymethylpyrimidine pyrophosphatase-like HAD family hydrolase
MVVTDLDGTLLSDDGVVSARTVAAIRSARRVGIHVVPATGRPPKAVWDLAAASGLGPLGVCSNGAALVDLDGSTVLETDLLPGDEAIAAVTAIRAALGDVRFATDDLDCFAHEPGFFEALPDWDEKLECVADICEALGGGTIQLHGRWPGLSGPDLMVKLAPIVGDRLTVTTSGADWANLAPPLVSKASRLDAVCARLDIDPAEVVAVGDHHNDLSMLAWAGTAMAVANAIPDVLAVVDRTLPSNDAHGVASLLEELVERYS